MQKLPEAPDRKRERRMRKEKEPSRQKKESGSLSAVTSGVTTPKSSGGRHHASVSRWRVG